MGLVFIEMGIQSTIIAKDLYKKKYQQRLVLERLVFFISIRKGFTLRATM